MPTSRRDFVTLSAATALGTLGGAPHAARDGWRAPDVSHLRNWLAASDVPGLSIAVSNAGDTRATFAGLRLAGGAHLVDVATVFEAASLSKPVFAFACLQLVKRGLLDLDRPLDAYLPAPYPIDDGGSEITARHVLSHTSGLQNWRFRPEQKLALAFRPGTRFSYSGEGYYFLQVVVEHILGTGIATFLNDTVLVPLGMTKSSYVWRLGTEANLALPHDDSGTPSETRTKDIGTQLRAAAAAKAKPLEQWTTLEVLAALPTLRDPQRSLPVYAFPNVATSLLTTPTDYARFLGHAREMQSLGMFDRQVRVNDAISWGLGIGIDTRDGMPFHWGDNDGYKNFFVIDPHADRSAVVLTNGDRGLNLAERTVEETAGTRLAASLWIA